jgi:nucleotide-binding universal stress UspA family protein
VRGRSGRGPCGATTQEVIQFAEVPVLLVGPACTAMSETADFKELVVCLDGSAAATAILPTALDWAKDLGLGMWLVDVVDPESAQRAARATNGDVHESTPVERVAHSMRRSHLDVNWEVLHGRNEATAIVEFASERSAPIIAMTTHGRTGLARVVAGSVTLAVLREAPCPVLVTRSRDLHD